MAENSGFSISRRGYSCEEVDEYISAANRNEAELKNSFANLQQSYDKLFEENSKLIKEKQQLFSDCQAMAYALKKIRSGNGEADADCKAQLLSAQNEIAYLKAKLEESAGATTQDCGEAASKMIEDVADVVQKLEKDARRKAEAITLSAKLEQAQAQLIKTRVNDEIKSLIEMLNSFLTCHQDATDNHTTQQ